jgi:hypothetical protein
MNKEKQILPVNELEPNFYIFGNKGNTWSNSAHIAKSGEPVTLCDTPMLSNNWARIENMQQIGCPECIEKYKKEYSKTKLGAAFCM